MRGDVLVTILGMALVTYAAGAWASVAIRIERLRLYCVQGVYLPLSPGRGRELAPWLNNRLFLNR